MRRAGSGSPLPRAHHGRAWRSTGIAEELARRIDESAYDDDLPMVSALADEFGVARGTVTKALQLLEDEGVVTRSVSRWSVARRWRRDLDLRQSFGQWALAAGHRAATLSRSRSVGRATEHEARWFRTRVGAPVLRLERVRALHGRPVVIERTTYATTVAPHVRALPDDVESVMAELGRLHGIRLAHVEHSIRALPADAHDSRLLGIVKRSPLVRLVSVARSVDGSVVGLADERYPADRMEFSMSRGVPAAPIDDSGA